MSFRSDNSSGWRGTHKICWHFFLERKCVEIEVEHNNNSNNNKHSKKRIATILRSLRVSKARIVLDPKTK
ncbi:hypothetical protein YC2023_121910 [Brassica napus]